MTFSTQQSQPLLSATGLRSVRGERELFSDLSFGLHAGELLQIHGANGSGKTTLLRIICRLTHADAGELYWNGAPVSGRHQAYVSELHYLGHLNGIKLDLSPLENLSFSASLNGTAPRIPLADALEKVALYGFENEPARTLSAGQRRRIGLASLLVSTAKVWILDEPFTALDVAGIGILEGLLHEHLESGGMVILASHAPVNLHERHKRELRLLT